MNNNYRLTNDNENILKELKGLISKSKNIYISVAFITKEGLDLLFNENDIKKIKIIYTTTEDLITNHKTLKYLYENNIKVKIINPTEGSRQFHSKCIIFESDNKLIEMVGSLNITWKALKGKIEDVSFRNSSVEEMKTRFSFLEQFAFELDENFLSEYKIINDEFKLFKEKMKKFRNEINLYPNEMQSLALKEIKEKRDLNINRILLWSATGTGKTYLSAFDARRYNFKKLIFIVHIENVLNDARRTYENIFKSKRITIIKGGNQKRIEKALAENDIIFMLESSIDALVNNQSKSLNEVDYFIFDEAHHIGPNNRQGKAINYLNSIGAPFILAMTATPYRTMEPMFLLQLFKNGIVGKIDIESAINKKIISPFKYWGLPIVETNGPASTNRSMVESFVKKIESNDVEVWDNSKIKGLVFANTTNDADEIALMLSDFGYKSLSYHASEKSQISERMINDEVLNLQSDDDELKFIVTVNKFNEGVDIPRINTIGMFSKTESTIKYSQQIGRGLRNNNQEGKYLNIIDMVGNHNNAHKKIFGLLGSGAFNLKKVLSFLSSWSEKGSTFRKPTNKLLSDSEINLNEITSKYIMDSISLGKIKFKDYYEYSIKKLQFEEKDDLEISEIINTTGSSVQNFIANYKDAIRFKKGKKSWLVNIFSKFDSKFGLISDYDNLILEAFSWMPLTVSTKDEKKAFIDLLDGKRVILKKRWYSYFTGRNVINDASSQLIEEDLRDYYSLNENGIKFRIDKINDKKTRLLLNKIKNYLIEIKNKDDYLIEGNWYQKTEISFMLGYVAVRTQGADSFSKQSEEYDEMREHIFYMNKLWRYKWKDTDYKNEVISNNTFNLAIDGTYDLSNKIVHQFIGSELGNKNINYLYIGECKDLIKDDRGPFTVIPTLVSVGQKMDKKYYDKYIMNTDYKLSDEELMYFWFNQ